MNENIYNINNLYGIMSTRETHAWRREERPKQAPLKKTKDPHTKMRLWKIA